MGNVKNPITTDEARYRDNVQTITTLEIAEMMEIEHYKVLRKLDGREENGKHIKGYIEILADSQMGVSDYFIESTYKDTSGKENRCYNVTKLGCDFLANKFTGEKGILFTARYVKRFRDMEDYIRKDIEGNEKLMMCLHGISFIADDLRLAESSRLFMYNGAFKDFGLPTSFLPQYTDNGNREQRSATELLNRNGCEIKTAKFNQLMIASGHMELRERTSSKGAIKEYKALTDKGLRYGVNLISNKNQKECQPYYYADTFMELYNEVTG